jgi:hypothetical protein
MKKTSAAFIQVLAAALVFTFCGGPEIAHAWAEPGDALPDAPSVVAQNTQPSPLGQQQAGSAANEQSQPAQGQTNPSQQPVEPPAGAAGAQAGETAGGPASTPAGSAIAPTRQRQVRSFLIKLGAVAAAGAAVGVVYALTRGTASTPPGAPGR